jgi:hypothetical protein
MVHITLPVFSDTGEEATRESLEVDEILPGQCRLLHSPALVDSLAKDDVMRTLPGTTWWYGNVYEMGDPKKPLDWWTRQERSCLALVTPVKA